MNKQQLSLRLSVSAGKSPHRGYPVAVTQKFYGAITNGHLAQRRRDAEQRTNGNPLCVSASLRANRPHRGYPVAVTQELYDAITKAISRRGAETQRNEQTATLSASQRLRGQIAPIAATRWR